MAQRHKDVRAITEHLRVVRWEHTRDPETIGEPENPWTLTLVVEKDLEGPFAGWKAEVEFELTGTGEVVPASDPLIKQFGFRSDAPAHWNDLPTQRALRAAHLGGVQREVREWLSFVPMETSAVVWIDAIERGHRSGRRGKQDRYYAMWAERRVHAQEVEPRRPNVWLAEQYGETIGAVTQLVYRARERGFLEGRPPRLTAKARDLLPTAEQEGEVTP